MEDQREGEMNLDLNLGPASPISGGSAPGNGTGSSLGENVNLDDWVGHSFHRRFREALRQRNRQRWRWRDWGHGHVPLESQHISMDLMVDSEAPPPPPPPPPVAISHDIHGTMQTGEGSNAAGLRNDGITKMCESIVTQSDGETADRTKIDVEKGINSDGTSFFDCNICLDLSKEPVVTSCGHLFCWPCLYRWLHIHSDAKECPVCKGEVTVKNVTPIFGRGNGARDLEDDPGVKIPDRPPARRVESLRQAIQRTALSIPMEEMIRRLGSRFDLTRDFFQPQEGDGPRNVFDRSSALLNRILTSRGRRREQNVAVPSDDVDLSLENETRPEIGEYRRLPHLFYRRSQSYRGAPMNVPSTGTTTSAERFVETVIRTPPPQGRSQEQPPSVEDRDSFSSITAVIHGESQTMDTAVEIDSTVSLSTSSSRRRNDASRISDVDSGDSRMPRRRRIN